MVIAVFDIGGSHISYGYFDVNSSRLIGEKENRTRSVQIGEANPLTVLVDLVWSAKKLYGRALTGLSMAVPGPFDYESGVSQMKHKLVSLYGLNLRRMLSETSGVAEGHVVFINDADAFLLGALSIAQTSTGRSIGITLGTGVGSSFANGSEILLGGEGVPAGGEIWNLPYGRGTVEDAISTRKLEDDYMQLTGVHRSVKAIAEGARDGELVAQEILRSFGKELAEVLELICTPFDPERILLGGGISSAGNLFLSTVYANSWCADRVSIMTQRQVAPLLGAAVRWKAGAKQPMALAQKF